MWNEDYLNAVERRLNHVRGRQASGQQLLVGQLAELLDDIPILIAALRGEGERH
jgi:hypothetical protein